MSFWGSLGHILGKVAPVAAAFIPGVGPIAAPLIGAAIGGGVNAIEGKNPLLGAATGALGGYGGSSLASGLGLGAASGASGGLSAASGIPSNLPGAIDLGGNAVSSGSGIGSTIGKMLLGSGGTNGLIKNLTGANNSGGLVGNLLNPQGMSSLGKGLGAVASADAKNRGAKLEAMLASDQMKLAEQAQRNQDLAALPRQIQTADYLASGGYTPKQNFSSNGRPIPKFDLGLKPISDNVKAAGTTLEKQLTDRLNTAPTYQDYSSVMNPSATETALNWASPVLSAMGAGGTPDNTSNLIKQIMSAQQPTTQIPTAPPISIPTPPRPVQPNTPPPNVAGLGYDDSDNGPG